MITLIIPAWQESLEAKLQNLMLLDPRTPPLRAIIVAEREIDIPAGLAKRGIEVLFIVEPQRRGKASAINLAMQAVTTPLVIIHDANTDLAPDAIWELCLPFQDPSVGGVAGEKRVRTDLAGPGALEGFYWRYESALKKMDARFHSAISGAGELFALRKELFENLPSDCLLDDLEISWQIISKGYRIEYAPKAITTEMPARGLRSEARRKIRIAAGAYQFLQRHSLPTIFRTSFRYGIQFLFRKWMRWVIWPILTCGFPVLIGVAHYFCSPHWLIRGSIVFTGIFFLMGMIGGSLSYWRIRIGWLGLPFYFLFMNYCQIRGWMLHRFGKPTVIWEKSDRSA